ncbi:ssDNA-binding transcriptional regulator [Scenedesmus sp. NREL 46B-D3]|nr:ssDNA-binding transcriptional regulator [Scenedesmus sp. NREL 46B-D3]
MGLAQPEGAAMYAVPQVPAAVPSQQVAAVSSAVFADFSIYKTKGALTVKPIKPTWAALGNNGWKMERNGTMLFELANPVGSGDRRYSWDQKVVISLQANELSSILAEPDTEHTFYHDTFKGQAGREGTLVKILKWSRAPDGRAYFINASVSDKANGINNSFYTFKRLIDYSIPYMLGWDTMFNTSA